MTTHPKAFISYSWDDDDHKTWVAQLATQLRGDGVDCRLDQWHAVPGDQLPHFMEREIRDNDFVIVVCTPKYRQKSDNRSGGVGYEGDIMAGEISIKQNHRKFIPVLARGEKEDAMPSWIAGKYFVDLRDCQKFADNYRDLFSTIAGTRPEPPRLGPAPTGSRVPAVPRGEAAGGSGFEIRILGVIVDEVTESPMDGTRGSALYRVPFRLSARPSPEWAHFFLDAWQCPPEFSTMHRPSIASVQGDRLILDGTTVEEIQKYHKKTLQLCVNEANKHEAQWRAKLAQQQAAAEERSRAHQQTVSDIASKIEFDR
jgi:hypothetical protein